MKAYLPVSESFGFHDRLVSLLPFFFDPTLELDADLLFLSHLFSLLTASCYSRTSFPPGPFHSLHFSDLGARADFPLPSSTRRSSLPRRSSRTGLSCLVLRSRSEYNMRKFSSISRDADVLSTLSRSHRGSSLEALASAVRARKGLKPEVSWLSPLFE